MTHPADEAFARAELAEAAAIVAVTEAIRRAGEELADADPEQRKRLLLAIRDRLICGLYDAEAAALANLPRGDTQT